MIKCFNRGYFSVFLFIMLLSHTLFFQAMDKSFQQEKNIVKSSNYTKIKPQSVEIKKELSRKYGNNIMNNLSYEPSRLNALFCDDEENKKSCAECISVSGCMLCSVLKCFCWYKLNLPHECICIPLLASMFCMRFFNEKVEKCLQKTPQKKDQRCEFQEISSLEDMECEIINK
jgi:hypothetical protein